MIKIDSFEDKRKIRENKKKLREKYIQIMI